jgi:hypothetical protein
VDSDELNCVRVRFGCLLCRGIVSHRAIEPTEQMWQRSFLVDCDKVVHQISECVKVCASPPAVVRVRRLVCHEFNIEPQFQLYLSNQVTERSCGS